MKNVDYKSSFFNRIKDIIIINCYENNIVSSVVAAIAAIVSNYGSLVHCLNSNNLFLLPADKNWLGKCYYSDTKKVYDSIEKCGYNHNNVYRAYSNTENCIKDFVNYLICSKRSKNGPLKYGNIIGAFDYKEVVNILIRADFFYDYFPNEDCITISNKIIKTIEEDKLFLWDEEEIEMSRKRYNKNNKLKNEQPQVAVNSIEVESISENTEIVAMEKEDKSNGNTIEHMYRVRSDWDKPMTQIFASPVYEDALKVALDHEGYKIYIDDDGELFEDPWVKEEQEIVDTSVPGVLKVIHPIPGRPIKLNNTPVYRNAIDKNPFKHLTGIFYFYDNFIINERGRITVHRDFIKPNPTLILGYIDLI